MLSALLARGLEGGRGGLRSEEAAPFEWTIALRDDFQRLAGLASIVFSAMTWTRKGRPEVHRETPLAAKPRASCAACGLTPQQSSEVSFARAHTTCRTLHMVDDESSTPFHVRTQKEGMFAHVRSCSSWRKAMSRYVTSKSSFILAASCSYS